MATGWKGAALGALGLIAMETLVTSSGAPGRVGAFFDGAAGVTQRFLDPTIPAIPKPSSSSSSTTATPAVATSPATPTVSIPNTIPGGVLS